MTVCNEQLERYATLVEEALTNFLPGGNINQVEKAMMYSLCGGGKRIRGAMVLAFYNLFHEDVAPALPFAAALEMVHAYSLIHDDLPCMDDDDLRRGKPACHIAFGEAVALLAGDGLLTLAFETMSCEEVQRSFDSGKILAAIRCLAVAAGTQGMIGGQMMDLANEGKAVTADVLETTDSKKTGALFCACAEIGCLLGGADARQQEACLEYTKRIGLVFQIVDDILDRTGDQELLGKPINSDIDQKKSTYVSLYGVDGCRKKITQLNTAAKEWLKKAKCNSDFLESLADMLAQRQN